MSKKQSSFYKDSIPELIKEYKQAHRQCLKIVGQDIDDDLSDDKLHNVLKAKRMGGEDAKYYAKEIDKLENELNGVDAPEEQGETKKKNWAKELAKTPGQ